MRTELESRGKSPADIEEMMAFVRWATTILNPVNGGTRESGGRLHQVVADADDLDFALELAGRSGIAVDPGFSRELIRVHAD